MTRNYGSGIGRLVRTLFPQKSGFAMGAAFLLRALHPGALPMNKLVLLYTNSRIVSMISLKAKNHPDPQSPVHPHAKTAKRENVAWRFHHSGHLSLI